MFDNVGRSLDEEAGRRDAVSVAITTLVLSTLICGALGVAGLKSAEAIALDVQDVELVFPDEPDDDPGFTKDDLPAAPPPIRLALVDDVAPVPVTPDEPPEDPPPLETPPPQPLKARGGSTQGTPNGGDVGVPNGTGTDPKGTGTGSGTGGGGDAREILVKVAGKNIVKPSYPRAARKMGLGDVRCTVEVLVNERGRALNVEVTECPTLFHDATIRAMSASTWYPARLDGQKVKARTRLRVNYKLR